MELAEISLLLKERRSEYDAANKLGESLKLKVSSAETALSDTLAAQETMQGISQSIQQTIHEKLNGVVTKCLKTVFGEEAYEFKIQFDQKRGKTEARLVFLRNGEEFDPTTETGGGVIDVASFGLRMATLMMKRPRPRSVLIMDEPFRFLSAEYQPNVSELLHTLTKEIGIQIIMVTHSEDMKIGKVVEF